MIDFYSSFSQEVCEPEAAYTVNRQLNLAWEIVEETGANLFLTGKAGTGKTTFLKKLREATSKRMIVLAPTGVAAINASGNTIHSFFQLPFAPYVPGRGFLTADKKYLNVSKQKRRLISSLSLLVIDEISMVRPDMLDAIDAILRRLRNSTLPFGGVQLLLIGDLRQLPPVVKEAEWQHLLEHYASPYFFESHALRKAGFQTVELSVVYRQSDHEFLEILNSIRDGKAGKEILDRLNLRCQPGFNPPDKEGYIRLITHNRNAAAINEARLSALPYEEYSFEAETEGEFPSSAYPAEQTLRLKEGAQVMFIKNDTGANRRYYNGMIGTVSSISEEKICVLPIGGYEVIEVEKAEWENTRYKVEETTKAVVQEAVGVFRQYPLQLAWAITIHKSQGLTFDKAIIDASHSFAPGQTYVALSRCRSLEGLVLDRPVPPNAVITDSGVNAFIGYCEQNSPDTDRVTNLKIQYQFTLLAELFDFEPIRRAYNDFHRNVLEYLVPLFPEIEDDMTAFKNKIESNLCDVGRRFIESYRGRSIADALSNPESGLTERIKKGCDYFIDTIDRLAAFIHHLPTDIENQTYALRLNNTCDSLRYLVELKKILLEYHSEYDFSAATYLDAKGRAVLAIEKSGNLSKRRGRTAKPNPFAGAKVKAEGSPQKEPSKEPSKKKPKKPKGYSIFETYNLFQEGKSISQIAAERKLKESTISTHLSALITMGKLKIEDIVDPETLTLFRKEIDSSSEKAFGEVYERLTLSRKGNPVDINIFQIFWRTLPKTPKGS